MNIVEYVKGKDSLENKKKKLFEFIDKLDKESYQLYSDVIDLKPESFYQIENLSFRASEYAKMASDLNECFEYLSKKVSVDYEFANKRFQTKRLLTIVTTIQAFIANPLLGIIAFVLLNHKASKDFVRELQEIEKGIDNYDTDKLTLIARTVNNSSRVLGYKLTKMKDLAEELEKEKTTRSELIISSNDIICKYLSNEISKEQISNCSPIIKNHIIKMLQEDLNTEVENLDELLDMVMSRENDGLKLIKEY